MTHALAQTASISLITALPGSGKTLRVVGWIKRAIEAGELVYVSNLNGLKIQHIPFDDPREWQDLPTGSVLVVDEAQRFFRARRGGDPPDYITAMETIRHKGIRLILITQQPNYLDAHLRGLVGFHEHLVRENGQEASKIWRHNEVIEDVRSEKGRQRYDSEVWAFPKADYALYESAEVHTVKRRMSSRMKRGLMGAAAALCLLAGIGYMSYRNHIAPAMADDAPVEEGGGIAAAAATGATPATAKPVQKPMTTAEYVQQLAPRVEGLIGSAPIFDKRQARAEPEVFCMAADAGTTADGEYRDASVTCLTEQGTRYVIPASLARAYARHGAPYNPFKAPKRDMPRNGPIKPAGASAAAQSASMAAPQISPYGDLEAGAPVSADGAAGV